MTHKKDKLKDEKGHFAYEGLDRIMHEKARLGIMTSLLTHPDGLLFNDLKELCLLTDGNLSRDIKVLNEAGLVEIWKSFKNNNEVPPKRTILDVINIEFNPTLERYILSARYLP